MTTNYPLDELKDNHDLIIDLLQEIVNQFDYGNDGDVRTIDTQFKEIARTIERLEKVNIPVPDALRAEKMRLSQALSKHTESQQRMVRLMDGLIEVTNNLRLRLGVKNLGEGNRVENKKENRQHREKSSAPKTAKAVLRQEIIQALRHYVEVLKCEMFLSRWKTVLTGRLLPGDMEHGVLQLMNTLGKTMPVGSVKTW